MLKGSLTGDNKIVFVLDVNWKLHILPREWKAKVVVWSDLSVDDVDRLNESLSVDHVKQVLADIFHLDSWQEDPRQAIVMDLYYYTLQFAQDNNFNREKTSTFFSIIKNIHSACVETPFGNLEHTFRYFKDLILCHSVNRPPFSIELFNAEEIQKISEYTINTYFRHFKMYKYAFTPVVRLDLAITYQGVPVSPRPSVGDELTTEGTEVSPEDEQTAEHKPKEGEETPADDVNDQTDNEEESGARKELRAMIQTYLAEEIKKVKATVEQQLKATEDSVNRKLEDDNQARSGRRDSLKKKK
ncbi:coiled-coil domain-containing protein 189-like isoform X2 [Pomacea canaliculata]|uniref:coiled-coil domain-containing protein 189-like isoform X2 n=1 Tax=Pomacea canaliculata TaxID=400727 RepID=UPI000D735F9B|nr:coiled-coil domain-containing protein 189-like isoform X2 [Pomacea canaliculata]